MEKEMEKFEWLIAKWHVDLRGTRLKGVLFGRPAYWANEISEYSYKRKSNRISDMANYRQMD